MYRAERIEFFIVYKCLNNCIFCSEADKFDNSELPFEQIKKILIRERKKGIKIAHFMGGEPTLHTKFLDILKFAKKLGFLTHIITNGIMFSSVKFTKEVSPYLDEIMVSIHGPNKRIHEIHTRNNRSFKLSRAGLKNLSVIFKKRLLGTTSITSKNLNYLPSMIDFFSQFGIKEVQYIGLIPSGNASRNFIDIFPRLYKLKRVVPLIIERAKEKGVTLRISGVPMCILGEEGYIYSHDLWENFKVDNEFKSDKKNLGKDNLLLWKEPQNKDKNFEIDIGRIKTEKCKKCKFASICGGIYRRYYQQYGDDELTPF